MADTKSAPKPGWMTTEFWVTAATIVVTALVMLGYVPRASSEELTAIMVDVATKAISLAGSAWTAVTYIMARVKAKSDAAVIAREESDDLNEGDALV